ncbi:hypothetical protein JZ751_024622 [Albula glossodonta]|uniref:Uncharacterized protein n=1 Tax=Albula glossodonta TaxID=121402 RepID=A0A8T2PBH7_9TELE|nr:hypothetical protein JZ751_024622 [Albula glossodonta]
MLMVDKDWRFRGTDQVSVILPGYSDHPALHPHIFMTFLLDADVYDPWEITEETSKNLRMGSSPFCCHPGSCTRKVSVPWLGSTAASCISAPTPQYLTVLQTSSRLRL